MLPTNPLLNATAPAGPHLPTATLRQYAAGTLAPAARHRVEAHALACPRCADILEGLLQTTPATTDQALAQLQQRLRRRVGQPAPAALPTARARSRNRWLVPQLAAAAALLFGLLAGGWWAWQQRYTAPAVATAPATGASAAGASSGANPGPTIVAAAPTMPWAKGRLSAAQRRAKLKAVLDGAIGATHCSCTTDAPDNSAELAEAAAAELAAIEKGANGVGNPPANTPQVAAAAQAIFAKPSTPRVAPLDTTATGYLNGRVAAVAVAPGAPAALVRDRAMPAAPPVPPTPAGGYAAWREKIRREATEFHPEEGEPAVSGAVQLRVTIGADGKVQEIRVLHGLRKDYDEEAQRLVCDGPGWVPGIGGGKRTTQAVDVTVPFQ